MAARIPDAVKCLAKDLDELLTFLEMPAEHQVKVRTTNVIERAFREVRRRRPSHDAAPTIRPASTASSSA